jgi:hypothetical protein
MAQPDAPSATFPTSIAGLFAGYHAPLGKHEFATTADRHRATLDLLIDIVALEGITLTVFDSNGATMIECNCPVDDGLLVLCRIIQHYTRNYNTKTVHVAYMSELMHILHDDSTAQIEYADSLRLPDTAALTQLTDPYVRLLIKHVKVMADITLQLVPAQCAPGTASFANILVTRTAEGNANAVIRFATDSRSTTLDVMHIGDLLWVITKA